MRVDYERKLKTEYDKLYNEPVCTSVEHIFRIYHGHREVLFTKQVFKLGTDTSIITQELQQKIDQAIIEQIDDHCFRCSKKIKINA